MALTKTERLKRARRIREHLSRYIDLQNKNLQRQIPDWDNRAWAHLLDASHTLATLIDAEQNREADQEKRP